MSDIADAHDKGLLKWPPSLASLYKYFDEPAVTPILQFLIQQSAVPLESVEDDFAIDSTGFAHDDLLQMV